MSFDIDIIPAFADNYIYVVSDKDLGLAMVVDPGEADGVLRFLRERDLFCALILNTHHHKDHVGGSEKLAQEYGAPIIGPNVERGRIDHLSRGVGKDDVVTFSNLRGHVIETHGHTSGHIAFHFPQIEALFCGDTLFSLGCGKLFEGTAAEMWASLKSLRDLPDETKVYCGHEYTAANGLFALAVDKNNPDLITRLEEVAHLRQAGKPTIPSTIGVEKKTNPFLRVDDKNFQMALAKRGIAVDCPPAAIFGALRSAKDKFGDNHNSRML